MTLKKLGLEAWALDKVSKVWGWYKKLPTWKKFFSWICLVAVVVFLVIAIIGVALPKPKKPPKKTSDEAHNDMVDTTIDAIDKDVKELEAEIIERKKELTKRINQARKIDADTVKRRDNINRATTMEDLDRLQEEYDL